VQKDKVNKILLIIGIFAFSLNSYSQEKDLIQYTGRVFNEYVQPLSFAHIIITNRGVGTISDKEGKFSFVVMPNDTIVFSSLGYKSARVIIPDTLNTKFYTRDVLIQADTIMIAELEIYPWKDYEEFKEAFVNLELPEDDMVRAQRNIALIKQQLDITTEPLPSANYRYMMDQNTWKSFNRGTYPTYQIFNVVAWTKFFEALKNGDFKNDKKKVAKREV
jgi:hypothetical protein